MMDALGYSHVEAPQWVVIQVLLRAPNVVRNHDPSTQIPLFDEATAQIGQKHEASAHEVPNHEPVAILCENNPEGNSMIINLLRIHDRLLPNDGLKLVIFRV